MRYEDGEEASVKPVIAVMRWGYRTAARSLLSWRGREELWKEITKRRVEGSVEVRKFQWEERSAKGRKSGRKEAGWTGESGGGGRENERGRGGERKREAGSERKGG